MGDARQAHDLSLAGKLSAMQLELALQPAIKRGCWRDTWHGWKQAAGDCCHYLPNGNIRVWLSAKPAERISRLVMRARVMGLLG